MMKMCKGMIAYLVLAFAGTAVGIMIGCMVVSCFPFLWPYYDGVIPLFASVGVSVCRLKKYRPNLLFAIGVNYVCASLASASFLAGIGMYSIPIAFRRWLVYNLDVDFALYTISLIKRGVRSLLDEAGGKEDMPAENEDI